MKYNVVTDVNNLMHFRNLFSISTEIEISGELEVTPYNKFNPKFSSDYWYFQYMILKNGKIVIEKEEIEEEYNSFFHETKINIEWICITDKINYQIKCDDGVWTIELFNLDLFYRLRHYGISCEN